MCRQALIVACLLLSHSLLALREVRAADDAPTVQSPVRDVFQQLLILSDSEVSKELDLSEQQRTQVTELKAEYYRWGLAKLPQSPGPGAAKEAVKAYIAEYKSLIEERDKEFQPKVWEALKGGQKGRFQQILWQFDVAEALEFDVAVAKQMQLTDEQRSALKGVDEQCLQELRAATLGDVAPQDYEKRVDEAEARRNSRAIDVLTEQQVSTWKGLIGGEFDIEGLRPRVDLRKGLRNASREFSPRRRRVRE